MSKVPDRARPSITSRLSVSLPGAIGAILFAGAVAFGSGMVNGVAPQSGTNTAAQDGHKGEDGRSGYQRPASAFKEDTAQADHNRLDKTPKPEPTANPEPKPENAPPAPPAPPAEVASLSLDVQTFDGKVKLAWSVFSGNGFAYYKIVRSSDGAVDWPLSAGDALAAYANDPNDTFFKDFPPCGATWFYRVFAVMGGDTGYAVLAASNVGSAFVECVQKPSPPPVYTMGFSAEVINGQVQLSWEQCTSDAFAIYKVVRSQTNPDPKYPLNSGTELIAAIGDPGTTSFVDSNVSSGQTWFYRVLSMGNNGWGWYPLGMTPVIQVTIP